MTMVRKKWIGFAILIVAVLAAITIWKVGNANQEKIVYVYSDTCTYCTSFSPKFEKVIKDYQEWEVEKLDIHNDEGYQKAIELGAEVTPTVYFVRNDQVVDKIEGDVSEKAFSKFLEKQIVVAGP
ncbi:thioredoxin family protein [Brevibacillus formosus]|uniref:thioredoxin family protein n=1 Tax=Brevibacillus formosus TaxID=54913 RepID=UPI003F1C655E